jgi:nitronate monooxygenase
MLKTNLCKQLGIEHPIFSVGFDAGAGPELAAAVSNAGGCGVLGGSSYAASYLREQIRRLRTLTDRPFGVNLILDGIGEGLIDTCLAERVPILVFFWGDPRPYVRDAHQNGVKVFIQVGSVDEARAAADAGVDAIIAQGIEAGGHVKGTTALSVLVPEVVDAVKPLPVIAAGGIADGRGLAVALCLGAQAVSMGTRFVASEEAFLPRTYKERIVASTCADTVYLELFDFDWPNAPHRVIRNEAVSEWEAAGRPPAGQRPGEGTFIGRRTRAGETQEIPRYTPFMVTPEFDGGLELVPLWAGQSCSLVKDIKPAAQIVHDVVHEAEQIIRWLSGLV